jgi:hypothetical protein
MRICITRARELDAYIFSSDLQASRAVVIPTMVGRISTLREELMRLRTSWSWWYQLVYSGLTAILLPPFSSDGTTVMV